MTIGPIGPGGSPAFAAGSSAILSLPSLDLSDDEARVLNWLTMRLFDQRPYLELRGLYYDGMQKIQDLGISIPQSLVGLRTVIGWPQIGIDSIDERCRVEGFRYPDSNDTDDDLQGIWQANNLDGEAQLAQIDALVYGRSYIMVGTAGPDDDTQGQPLITAESPINMSVAWNARMRRPVAALQLYLDTDFTSDMYGQEVAALYLPDHTIHMARTAATGSAVTGTGKWEITDRDTHNLGRVPVVRMANRQRLSNRDGLSEITPAWMNTTDSACRTLLGMEVGREFFAAPRRYVLGATEDAFKNSDGSSRTAWETYLDKMFALERDEEGQIPTVGEFKASDPSTFTKLIDTYTKIMSGLTSLPPHYLGLTSDGNPASADAIRSEEARLVKRVQRKMLAFGEAWEDTLRLALLVRDGSLPDGAHRMETDWADPNTPTMAQTSDAITKQVMAGSIPATSDVTLKKLGYSAVERNRLEVDRKKDEGAQFLQEIAHALTGKVARVDKALAADVTPQPPGTGQPATIPGAPMKKPVPTPAEVFGRGRSNG